MNGRRGQSIAEYLLIFAVVAAAIMTMQVYAKRGIQGVVKTAADQMSPIVDPVTKEPNARAGQALGIFQEAGDQKKLKEMPAGAVAWKESSVTTDAHRTYTTRDVEKGGHEVVDDTDVTHSTGTSTTQVTVEMR